MFYDEVVTDIFLSRPTEVEPNYIRGVDNLLSLLASMGLSARTLGATDYPIKSPMGEVIKIMSECSGAMILGYPQLRIDSGSLRGVKLKKSLILPTEWNHIEGAIACVKELPILLIHDTGVGRGIFVHGVLDAFIHQADLTKPDWCLDTSINAVINSWRKEVHKCKVNGKMVIPTTKQQFLEEESVRDIIQKRDLLREALGKIVPEMNVAMNSGGKIQDQKEYIVKIRKLHERLEQIRPIFQDRPEVQTALTRIGNLGGTASTEITPMRIEFFDAFYKDVELLKKSLNDLESELVV